MLNNPASIFIAGLEEHYRLVFCLMLICFMTFIAYDYWKKYNRNVVETIKQEGEAIDDFFQKEKGRKDRWGDDVTDASANNNKLSSAIPEDIPHIPYKPQFRSDAEMEERSREFYNIMNQRRTVRMFSKEPISEEVLKNILKTAGTSPSGAHTEPWTFVLVKDKRTKEAIREIVEDEEYTNYDRRMSRQWVTDLKPFKTRHLKPYLTEAPALILLFRQTHSFKGDGDKKMHYYSEASVAIAAGILLAAIQFAGLVTVTSTPLNCGPKLSAILNRPSNERLALLLPIGRPHPDATVPDLKRKSFEELTVCF